MIHEYIDRTSATVITERLFSDRVVKFLYNETREYAPALFNIIVGKRMTHFLGMLNFDLPLTAHLLGNKRFLNDCGVNLEECVLPPAALDTPRKIFERQIKYWECRPMPDLENCVVSPADARLAIGSFKESSSLFLKNKLFSFEELLGPEKSSWLHAFRGGHFAVFRLTPDKYHYNHAPVSGLVLDHYEIDGAYHSCNPNAIIEMGTPYSKNRRVVTILDTDVSGGSQVGLVAMIEVVALMIGQVVQCYSDSFYESPTPVIPGMFIKKGQPKSLYRPGSSTDILIFQDQRVTFAEDLVSNHHRTDVQSRYSAGFGFPLVETEVDVRSLIGYAPGTSLPSSTR